MRLYFTSPVAWVVFTMFLLIGGYFFYSIFAFYTLASMQSAMNPAMGRDLNVTDSVMLLLMGGMFIAVGVCASSLTENQIVAAITTFGVLLLLWVLGWSADYAGGTAGRVLQHLSLLEHNDSFAKGVLDTKDIIYYANFI